MLHVRFVLNHDAEHTYAAALAVLNGQFNIPAAVEMSIAQLADHGFIASAYSAKIDVYFGKRTKGKTEDTDKSYRVQNASAKERILHWKRFVYKQDPWMVYFNET